MSAIEELKEQLNQIATESEQTAGEISEFGATFDQQVEQIEGLIGNTASGADRDIVAIFDSAKTALEEAAGALLKAAQQAQDFSADL